MQADANAKEKINKIDDIKAKIKMRMRRRWNLLSKIMQLNYSHSRID